MADNLQTKNYNSDTKLKIAFCMQELIAVKNLLAIIKLDFYARVLSRQAIIRIQDFILLIQQYKNQSNFTITEKQNAKKKINHLNTKFESTLKIKRDKLGAHIQDLDFFERITKWQEINYNELLSLYDEIQTICGSLHINTNIDFLTLSNVDVKNIKTLLEEKNIEDAPRFGNDALSLTRQNQSGGLIPNTLAQNKISVINSIRLMLDFEISLYAILTHNAYKLALRMLITNDIMSFIDNINSRSQTNGVGLKLILQQDELKDSKVASNHLDSFLNKINPKELKNIKEIRNKIGSHVDEKTSLKDLMILIKKSDFDDTLKIYNDILNMLLKVCNSVFYLKHLMLSPMVINGVLADTSENEKPFFKDVKNIITKNDDINDASLYDKKINSLLDDKNLKNNEFYEKTRFFFYKSFLHSDVVKISLLDDEKIEVRKTSEFFIELLNKNNNTKVKRIALNILTGCYGNPKQIVYTLLNSYENNIKTLHYEYIHSFGDVMDKHSQSIFSILKNLLNADDFNIRYFAILSLIKIDVKDRGVRCVNSNLTISSPA